MSQIDPTISTKDYVSADDDLDTCFNDADEWREELRSMVCEESPSLQRKVQLKTAIVMKKAIPNQGVLSSLMMKHSKFQMTYYSFCLNMDWKIQQEICINIVGGLQVAKLET